MMRSLPIVMLFIGMALSACENMDDEMVANEPLSGTMWKLEGYKETHDTDFQPSNFNYVLEFVNDSVYAIKLDINKVYGNFEYSEAGSFQATKKLQTTTVCCDSEYSNTLIRLFAQSQSYRSGEHGLLLSGVGELYFTKE